ncbi:hypothetical protein GQ42DRAFT_87355 [Ramicandelaber brevisporus]|nr:hypothetical protein GQ42DRAFT_87355 [Ramicandelaber brevisporus]
MREVRAETQASCEASCEASPLRAEDARTHHMGTTHPQYAHHTLSACGALTHSIQAAYSHHTGCVPTIYRRHAVPSQRAAADYWQHQQWEARVSSPLRRQRCFVRRARLCRIKNEESSHTDRVRSHLPLRQLCPSTVYYTISHRPPVSPPIQLFIQLSIWSLTRSSTQSLSRINLFTHSHIHSFVHLLVRTFTYLSTHSHRRTFALSHIHIHIHALTCPVAP